MRGWCPTRCAGPTTPVQWRGWTRPDSEPPEAAIVQSSGFRTPGSAPARERDASPVRRPGRRASSNSFRGQRTKAGAIGPHDVDLVVALQPHRAIRCEGDDRAVGRPRRLDVIVVRARDPTNRSSADRSHDEISAEPSPAGLTEDDAASVRRPGRVTDGVDPVRQHPDDLTVPSGDEETRAAVDERDQRAVGRPGRIPAPHLERCDRSPDRLEPLQPEAPCLRRLTVAGEEDPAVVRRKRRLRLLCGRRNSEHDGRESDSESAHEPSVARRC